MESDVDVPEESKDDVGVTNVAQSIAAFSSMVTEGGGSVGDTSTTDREYTLEPIHRVFISHNNRDRDFVEQLCLDLERCDRFAFFDRGNNLLPRPPRCQDLIFQAIRQCEVAVVILSKEFFTRLKWSMLELATMVKLKRKKPSLIIIPVYLHVALVECRNLANQERWLSVWQEWATHDNVNPLDLDCKINPKKWLEAMRSLFGATSINSGTNMSEVSIRKEIVEAICRRIIPGISVDDVYVQKPDISLMHELVQELKPQHKIYLCHSGAQKGFVEQLYLDFERRGRRPYFDLRRHSLPIGEDFATHIFQAIRHCEVAVVVLSQDFFTRSKWPMLELTEMMKLMMQNGSLRILPVFFQISHADLKVEDCFERWKHQWCIWAASDSRLDIQAWEGSIKLLISTNGISFRKGMSEVMFREEIVDVVCRLVLPDIRWDDFHIQGRCRMIKVIEDKINQMNSKGGNHVVGLYGGSGIGKTTICKALCNYFSMEFNDRVCHIELQTKSTVELLQEVLRRLTDTCHEFLEGLEIHQYQNMLKRRMHKRRVFLAIDNVLDNIESMEQIKEYLRTQYHDGSIVVVTTRFQYLLTSLGINKHDCLEMPELVLDEARSLLLYYADIHSLLQPRNETIEELISRCIQLCCFLKGDGNNNYYYNPNALKALGLQFKALGRDPIRWAAHLDELGQEYQSKSKHKIFLSHSGAQKPFVEQLCVDVERCDRYPFFDKKRDSLPIGDTFPNLIFEAIENCLVGVVIISEEFFTQTKWPMLELVAMAKLKEEKGSFKIIPVFFGISRIECRDPSNHEKWFKIWKSWASGDERIKLSEWKVALKLFGSITGLAYTDYNRSEVSLREQIVEAICTSVFPETKWDDSHVQGKLRLCKVICDKIDQTQMSSIYKVFLVGMYGVGGIGKSTICQALCNQLYEKFYGRVCRLELEKQSKEDLLREVLKKLTNVAPASLVGLNEGECLHRLKNEIYKQGVFLVIDNVSEKSLEQAKTYLQAGYKPESIVLVIARSLDHLKWLGIKEDDCLEMPELELDEAKSLFVHHAAFVPETRNEAAEELILKCVNRCHFRKGTYRIPGKVDTTEHYHPLALDALGTQLGYDGYDEERWMTKLEELDMLNYSGEKEFLQPIFSILRISFDSLKEEDRLLFMDVGVFLPEFNSDFILDIFEWLCMVRGSIVDKVKERLEYLKTKSLFEYLGDGTTPIGMHDLWHEFSEVESQVEGFESRRWVCIVKESDALDGIVFSGPHWPGTRMSFLEYGVKSLNTINFAEYSNVWVLKVVSKIRLQGPVTLNLKGLKRLKSLELEVEIDDPMEIKGLKKLEKLRFLRWSNIPTSSTGVEDIKFLTNLEILQLKGFKGGIFPNLENQTSLRMVSFLHCNMVTRFQGLSDLVTLQRLEIRACDNLEMLPDLLKLTRLKSLAITGCPSLNFYNIEVFNINTLSFLETLDCSDLPMKEVLDLSSFPKLKALQLRACKGLMNLTSIRQLTALEMLNLDGCSTLNTLPDLRCFPQLRELSLKGCQGLIMNLTSSGNLTTLEKLNLEGCTNLKALPDLNSCMNLRELQLSNSGVELSQIDIKQLKASCGWLNLTCNTIYLNTSINVVENTSSSHSKANPLANSFDMILPTKDVELCNYVALTPSKRQHESSQLW